MKNVQVFVDYGRTMTYNNPLVTNFSEKLFEYLRKKDSAGRWRKVSKREMKHFEDVMETYIFDIFQGEAVDARKFFCFYEVVTKMGANYMATEDISFNLFLNSIATQGGKIVAVDIMLYKDSNKIVFQLRDNGENW